MAGKTKVVTFLSQSTPSRKHSVRQRYEQCGKMGLTSAEKTYLMSITFTSVQYSTPVPSTTHVGVLWDTNSQKLI